MEEEADICPLCDRELGPLKNTNRHHLIPKSRGGTEVIRLHRICHSKIHSLFTEKELEQKFNTIEALRTHEEMASFIKWVAKRPPSFYDRNIQSNKKGR